MNRKSGSSSAATGAGGQGQGRHARAHARALVRPGDTPGRRATMAIEPAMTPPHPSAVATRRVRRRGNEEDGVSSSDYILAGQLSELERLQLQARVWEPAGSALLEGLGNGDGLHVVDVGCGCLGWLRILSRWVGPGGAVTGTDLDDVQLE